MSESQAPQVLILTPMKNAASFIDGYFDRIWRLSYPAASLSLGVLVSDSTDGTFELLKRPVAETDRRWVEASLRQQDFGFKLPPGMPRWLGGIQKKRRSALARSRNQLLSRALQDQSWVLWLDVDVIDYPEDIIQRLLATEKRIVHPNCVLDFGGPSFDQNAWRGVEKALLSDLRGGDDLVPLDSVGGTMLLIDADLHRDGLVFPPFPYGQADPTRIPRDVLRIETEGLALMARDMGETCWGMPNLEIRHFRG